MKVWAFVVYTVLYEALVLGGTGYAVFILGYSGWWFALACVLSGSQLKPSHFNELFDKKP